MFKFIGIILTFSTCTCIGFYKAGEVRRRKALLTEFRELLQQISTEMGYFKEPLPNIFQRIMERNHPIDQTSPVTLLLRQCSLQTTQMNNENFFSLWSKAVASTYENEPLNADDIQIMTRCGSFLGQSDFQSQKGHFALLQGELDKQIREAEENIRTKAALYSKAGLSVGAVIAIALL